ncbi:glucosamine-6-phosphate deaminase [candidate division KSB1 bacterium]|nr:glucosamine-6-phosphate deaminase [candidate division KSB1 bacterium]
MSAPKLNKHHSEVERIALEKSGRKLVYRPTEKIGVIEVDNFPALGKLTALRFIEWVQGNPGGVIALPTGKTPEHFIKWVTHYLRNWNIENVQNDLAQNGINSAIKPDMRSLHFVQIDEFYPINPQQRNSFYYYVNKYYINEFGLDPEKALLLDTHQLGIPSGMPLNLIFPDNFVDLSLRTRQGESRLQRLQKSVIEAVDQYCTDYEQKIRSLGGIGFFLGGIGPDGHIGFNVSGSDHFSTTRLTQTNYETQAAAAIDLGGIEVARNRLVITIGLSTISYNKDAVVIIIAAGEAKSKIISDTIQLEKNNLYPATILHDLPNSRFYLTKGARKYLVQRRLEDLVREEVLDDETVERIITNLSVMNKKPILELIRNDFKTNIIGAELLRKLKGHLDEAKEKTRESLIKKINAGLEPVENETFLHTAPHHDDIMLGYLGYIIHLVRSPHNKHYFNYLTSGFNAVTNLYVLQLLEKLSKFIETSECRQLMRDNYFDPTNPIFKNRDVNQFLDGVAAHSRTMKDEGESRRVLRNLIFLFEEDNIGHLKDRIDELKNYFSTQYPGKKDLAYIQQLKGMSREWEADLLWAHFGFDTSNVIHSRLGFYKGEIFTEEPEIGRDVMPILQLIENLEPTQITVALDPEGSGPDTHYKVMQAISEALKIYEKNTGKANLKIIGYRNVWHRFHPSEANIFVPVSLGSLSILESTFMNYFGSQRDASFPSYEYDGPFCRLAQRIMVEQYQQMKICLGRDFFMSHVHPRIRATHGLVFLKKMTFQEFYQWSIELKKSTENID